MEEKVVFVEKESVKNMRLKVIQYLISKGVFPESIRFSKQELQFKYNPEMTIPQQAWSQELTEVFKGRVEFRSKFTEQRNF